jgi:hydrogenase-4 component E
MLGWVELLLVLLILSDMALLGLSRLGACIRVVAFQGVLLGVFTVMAHSEDLTVRFVLLGVVTMAIKGIVFPRLLFRAIRESGVRCEVEPFVGYIPSILLGVLMTGGSLALGSRLTLAVPGLPPLVLPTAFMTALTGLFLLASRRTALLQVLGYLSFENGIYTLGVGLVGEIPALLELAVLLDVFVAVFVMGIAIYHIHQEFDHIDADQLSSLKG